MLNFEDIDFDKKRELVRNKTGNYDDSWFVNKAVDHSAYHICRANLINIFFLSSNGKDNLKIFNEEVLFEKKQHIVGRRLQDKSQIPCILSMELYRTPKYWWVIDILSMTNVFSEVVVIPRKENIEKFAQKHFYGWK